MTRPSGLIEDSGRIRTAGSCNTLIQTEEGNYITLFVGNVDIDVNDRDYDTRDQSCDESSYAMKVSPYSDIFQAFFIIFLYLTAVAVKTCKLYNFQIDQTSIASVNYIQL